jgi:hypothetical protein
MRISLGIAMLLAAGVWGQSASAGLINFSGSRSNVDAPGPAAPRCGTRATSNIVNNPPFSTASGISTLGAFTPTLSHCIQLPLSSVVPNVFDLGEFTFDFGGGNILSGTYSGYLTFVSAGVFDVFQTHVVTGGAGFFAGSSGGFESSGQLTFPRGRPTVTQVFAGKLDVPAAVPEPATWLILILGFGMVGTGLRRRTHRAVMGRLASTA